MQRAVRATGLVALLLFVGMPAALAGATGRVWFVPWKVLEPSDPPPPAALQFTLYWVPSSPDELKRSPLVTSRALANYSARCVAMHVIRLDDVARLEQFGASELPVAILTERDRELARVGSRGGALRSSDVEVMVRGEFHARELLIEADLDRARELLQSGERDGALTIYKSVALQRCAFPRLAREAQRAIRRMRR